MRHTKRNVGMRVLLGVAAVVPADNTELIEAAYKFIDHDRPTTEDLYEAIAVAMNVLKDWVKS